MATLTTTTTTTKHLSCHLTTTAYLLLLLLHLHGPLGFTDVCTLLLLKIPSLHTLSIRLAYNGYIAIDKSSNLPIFTLTDSGRAAIAAYLPYTPNAS
ncbi:hypothetical protein JAO29_15520 [Edaphobacter sp. HDX4]|uniref:hypothetical protein n=1 Tax=Edaphobacter sp. HDX4 TaxID=2794064 RepID=UPI002FE588CE